MCLVVIRPACRAVKHKGFTGGAKAISFLPRCPTAVLKRYCQLISYTAPPCPLKGRNMSYPPI